MNKKVLVTGASGEIGFEILQNLVSQGFHVLAHSSRESSSKKLQQKVELIITLVKIYSQQFYLMLIILKNQKHVQNTSTVKTQCANTQW